jgi:hypothetical protein
MGMLWVLDQSLMAQILHLHAHQTALRRLLVLHQLLQVAAAAAVLLQTPQQVLLHCPSHPTGQLAGCCCCCCCQPHCCHVLLP